MNIRLTRMFVDTDWTEEAYKPDSFGVFIPGRRGRIFANVNYPGGEGPHPLIVLCHGLPGNEQLADFASVLRYGGFAVITFHYSGSWGSDGEFSVVNSLQDVDAVLEYALANERGLFDTSNIFLIGHSLGGLVGAYAIATHEEIKAGALLMPADIAGIYRQTRQSPEAKAAVREIFDGFGQWLVGFDWDTFAKECEANLDKFDLPAYGAALAQKPLLTVAGTMDADLPREQHVDALNKVVREMGLGKLRELSVPTNHGICDQRYTIMRAIAEFFAANIS